MNKQKSNAVVLDLASYRAKKQTDEDLSRGRTPLYMSHKEGKVTARSPHLRGTHTEDFGDRVSKIKASLEKINTLMVELKKMSSKDKESQK